LRLSKLIPLLLCVLSPAAADYTIYIGDSYEYQVTAMTTGTSGNTFVTGSRAIVVSGIGVRPDVFVSKLDPSGNLSLLTTLSGKGSDQANGIALDPSGNIYIVGVTTSPDFPVSHTLPNAASSGVSSGGTGFLVKLDPNGTVLYSTLLGGAAGSSSMHAVAVDPQGNAYVTGETFASDYPHTDRKSVV